MSAVGLDLIAVDEVRRALDEFGERYLRRVFTPGEIADCAGDPRALAARWAAKEAAIKALRPGPGVPTPPREAEVVGTVGGPGLRLHGGLADRAVELGWRRVHLSLTGTVGFAAAVVLAETGGAPSPVSDRRGPAAPCPRT